LYRQTFLSRSVLPEITNWERSGRSCTAHAKTPIQAIPAHGSAGNVKTDVHGQSNETGS
jgi:hypothetical protein